MENPHVHQLTLCSEAALQVQSGHKTLSQLKNDLLVLTGSGTWGCKQPC
jgi:hypothetical protein